LDGKIFSPESYVMGIFEHLLKTRYHGEVYLKYTFTAKTKPSRIRLLAESMNSKECLVNGNPVFFNGSSDFEKAVYASDIAKFVRLGENEILFKIDFYQDDFVYYALFGENVTEGLKNSLTYDTEIESIYLQGDFGVYAEDGFKDGKEKNVLIANSFYIDTPPKTVTETVSEGYPFFAGNMTLEKTFTVSDLPCTLYLDGRYALSKIEVNGKEVKKSYFGDKVDVTDYVKKGENVIRITLYSGNRNLLGPHHFTLQEESLMVNFYVFDMNGSWNDLKSEHYRDSYSFVKFGLFNNKK